MGFPAYINNDPIFFPMEPLDNDVEELNRFYKESYSLSFPGDRSLVF